MTSASGEARSNRSARVSTRRETSELLGFPLGTTPVPAPTIRVVGSSRNETGSPPPAGMISLATIPLTRGTAPVKSALCPGAVSVAAWAKRSSRA